MYNQQAFQQHTVQISSVVFVFKHTSHRRLTTTAVYYYNWSVVSAETARQPCGRGMGSVSTKALRCVSWPFMLIVFSN
jgi:hypothetical protein